MKRTTTVLLVLALFALPDATRAGLIEGGCDGSGNTRVTCDAATGLEWLDLTQTVGLSIRDFEANVGGWLDAGWSVATGGLVDELFVNAGLPHCWYHGGEHVDAVEGLLHLLGTTSVNTVFGRFGQGFARGDGGAAAPTYLVTDLGEPTALVVNSLGCCLPLSLRSAVAGVWAYRPAVAVPEPGTTALAAFGLLLIITARRYRRH